MTDVRAASRRRARSAVVANYIHEISTRHRDATPSKRFQLPVIRVTPAAPMTAVAEGCA
jgi:hypothetical protein